MIAVGGRFRRAGGFSLLELLAVLTLIALASSTVLLVLRGPVLEARLAGAIEQVRELDASIRRRCVTDHQPAMLSIDRTTGCLTEIVPQGDRGRRLELSRGLTIDRFQLVNDQEPSSSEAVFYSRDGHSPSWAIRITSPRQSRWLVCAGGAGQFRETADETSVRALFAALYEYRVDGN